MSKRGLTPFTAVEVFMSQVVAVLILHLLDALSHLRVDLTVERVGGEHPVGKVQGGIDATDNALTAGAHHVRVLIEQLTHGHHRRPAGLGVVAYVEHAAHLEFAA